MEIQQILSFLLASILLALMPGPDNIYVLTESATRGSKTGISISAGLSLGVLVHTLAAATGLSLVIQNSAMAFSIIKYAGALYLLYLAYQAFKERIPIIDLTESSGEQEEFKVLPLFRRGFFMNVLNPKVSLFFIAFLPQFIISEGFAVSVQMVILGVIFMLQAFLVFSGIALLSGKLQKHLTNSRFWQISKYLKVGVLFILGVALAFSKR